MAKRSLILTSTQAGTGKKLMKTITDINPAAGAQKLLDFTAKLNNMTTNAYVQTDCIDKFNVDTEIPPVDERKTPTFTLTRGANFKKEAAQAGHDVPGTWDYTTNSDGAITFALTGQNLAAGTVNDNGTLKLFLKRYHSTHKPTAGTLIVYIEGTEQFKPGTFTFEYDEPAN